ncbi:MAG TPA: hypothetical protein VK666_04040 [Chryseolinea sp.]|nr:hypothetical protein [Chryseolinea sp.]
MLRKFFPRDKNYVLEQAQLALRQDLLTYLVDFVKVDYLLRCNPLGLKDDTSLKILAHISHEHEQLHEFYINLAGVFRFQYYKDNQLTFLFDGRGDFEKYQDEWSAAFKRWVAALGKQENFSRAILELTVFYPDEYTPQMAGLRLSTFITKFFDVKIDPLKGIVKRVA